jgi:hypothetical protein
MRWKRSTWVLAALVLLLVGGAAYLYLAAPRVISVPIGARVALDNGPLGDLAFNSDKLVLNDLTIDFKPGGYKFDTPAGPYTLDLKAGTVMKGNIGVHVAERGEHNGGRWVKFEADDSELTFEPAIQITEPHGLTADVHQLSSRGSSGAVKVVPLVAQSLSGLVAARISTSPQQNGGAKPGNPVRNVSVTAGAFGLRDGAKIQWAGNNADKRSWLAFSSGSQIRVQDLKIEEGKTVAGKLSFDLGLDDDSQIRAGNNAIRLATIQLRGTLDIAGHGTTTTFDDIHMRLPKQQLAAALAAALPKSIPLDDRPIADAFVGVFKGIRLTNLRVEPGLWKFEFSEGRIICSGQPIVRGNLKALRRPLKLSVSEKDWIPLDFPMAAPLNLSGTATVEPIVGRSLLDTRIRVTTVCDSAVIGEPAVEGMPDILKAVTPLIGKALNVLPVKGKALPEYIKELASRELLLPVVGSNPSARAADWLERISLRSLSYKLVGDEVVITGQVTLRTP